MIVFYMLNIYMLCNSDS